MAFAVISRSFPLPHAVAAALACLPRLALSADATPEPGLAADAALPAVRVTAPRGGAGSLVTVPVAPVGVLGERSLVETPFSVQTHTRELMDRQQAMTLNDVLKNDPSVTLGNVAVPFLLIRGFPIDNAGTLYDGLPGHGALTDGRVGLQAIERMDVLKGASAFLSGIGSAGSLGGIVNYIPKRPGETAVRTVGLGWASRSLFNAEADLGDRFGADRQFGYRLNLGWRDGEQAVRRYDWDQKVAALALDWRASTDLTFNLEVDHARNHLPQLPPFYLVAAGLPVPKAPDTTRSAALPWDDFKTTSDNVHLRGDWRFAPGWSLTAQALSGRGKRPETKQARMGMVMDAQGNVALFGGQNESSTRTDSGQLMLRGRLQAGGMAHQVTAGLSSTRQRFRSGGESLGVFPTNLYDPAPPDDRPEPPDATFAVEPSSRIDNKSVFLSDTIDIADQWSVLAGARHVRLKVDNHDGNGPNETSKTVPTAALMFKPRPGALVYLNHAQGLEQGGSLTPDLLGPAGFLPARLTRQLELGAKLDQGGMSYTAALFDMRRPHEYFSADAGQNVQRGTERHRGLELTASGRLTPGLTVSSGLMWLQTRLSGTGGDTAVEGKHVPGVPRLTAHVWAEYRIAAVPGLAVNGGLYRAGRQYLDNANTQTVPSWTRIDVGANWRTTVAGTATTFLLNVENLADKDYWASSHGGILTSADPRTLKLAMRTEF